MFYDIKGSNPTKGADRHKRVCGQPLSAAQHIAKAARAYPSTFRDPALLDTGRIDPCFKTVEVDFQFLVPPFTIARATSPEKYLAGLPSRSTPLAFAHLLAVSRRQPSTRASATPSNKIPSCAMMAFSISLARAMFHPSLSQFSALLCAAAAISSSTVQPYRLASFRRMYLFGTALPTSQQLTAVCVSCIFRATSHCLSPAASRISRIFNVFSPSLIRFIHTSVLTTAPRAVIIKVSANIISAISPQANVSAGGLVFCCLYLARMNVLYTTFRCTSIAFTTFC